MVTSVGSRYFICHSTVDADLAWEVVSVIEAAGHEAWYAPRDIPAGERWPAHITRAIHGCDVMLLLGTAAAFDSKQVEREVVLADNRGRPILPIIVDGASSDSIDYYLGSTQVLVTARSSLAVNLRKHFGLAPDPARYRFLHREYVDLPGGGVLTFRRWGDGLGTPVLLLHGLGLTADDWDADAQVKAMASRSAAFIAPDLPHHTPWDEDRTVTLPDVAPRLGAMMSRLGIERYGVIGHSLGGAIALHLTARDQRAMWCVAGGVGTRVWEASHRKTLSRVLQLDESPDESDQGLLTFLRSRNHNLTRLATLCEGPLPPLEDLRRISGRVTLISTEDDRRQTEDLVARGTLRSAKFLPGDHVSSWISGEFFEHALNQHVPRRREDTGSGGAPTPTMLVLSGLPGTGKTTIAAQVAATKGLCLVSRDIVRHELVSYPDYSLHESERVAAEVERRASAAIEKSLSIVIEGTGVQREVRESLKDRLLDAHQAGFVTSAIWLDGEPSVVKDRLSARAQTQRLPEDKSQADESIYNVMRSRARPGWLGNRCDVTIMSAHGVADWVGNIADGTVSPADAPGYLLSNAVLTEAAAIAARSASLPQSQWVDELLGHIAADADAGLFERWGNSTLVDSNVGRPVISHTVLRRLLGAAGLRGGMEVLNAGLAHTYAYLFADVPTPYGYKRDRWVDGRLQCILGTERGRLLPVARVNTLLANVTAALDAHLEVAGYDWVDTRDMSRSCLVEEDPGSGITTTTWLLVRRGVQGAALAYVVTAPGEEPRYVTVFPTDAGAVVAMREEAHQEGPLIGRFNAVLPDTSGERARRTWIESGD